QAGARLQTCRARPRLVPDVAVDVGDVQHVHDALGDLRPVVIDGAQDPVEEQREADALLHQLGEARIQLPRVRLRQLGQLPARAPPSNTFCGSMHCPFLKCNALLGKKPHSSMRATTSRSPSTTAAGSVLLLSVA